MEHGEASRSALERAVALAENNQASLRVVDVIPREPAGIGMLDGGAISGKLRAAMVREHNARMEPLTEPDRQRLAIWHKVLLGTSFLEVIRAELRNQRVIW